MTDHTLDDWLNRKSVTELTTGTIQQGGIWGYTHCRKHKDFCELLVHQYGRWRGGTL
jgi:hypothetical protein